MERPISSQSLNSSFINRSGVCTIPYTKSRYYEEQHKMWDSLSEFSFLGQYSLCDLLDGETMVYCQLHFFSSFFRLPWSKTVFLD